MIRLRRHPPALLGLLLLLSLTIGALGPG